MNPRCRGDQYLCPQSVFIFCFFSRLTLMYPTPRATVLDPEKLCEEYPCSALLSKIGFLLSSRLPLWWFRLSRFSQRRFSELERAYSLTDRLYDLDRLMLDHPEVERILFQESQRKAQYFVPEATHDDTFFQLKAILCMKLNFFDEFISTVSDDTRLKQLTE